VRTLLIALYLLTVGLRLGLAWLNVQHRQRNAGRVPAAFEGVVEPALLERMSRYNADRERFGMLDTALSALVVAVFFFAGGLSLYDRLLAHWIAPGWFHAVGFFVGLHVLGVVLELPLSLYSTFRIEQRHGFNRMTVSLFFADFAKSLVIGVILVGIASSAGYGLYHAAPNTYWLWLWLFAVVMSITLMLISPYVIEPLFIKTTPLDAEGLVDRVRRLAEQANVTVRQVLQMDASRRTAHSNAYFTGIGRVKRVVLFDTLLARLSEDEVVAVLAHELGHWKLRHITQRLLSMALLGLGLLYVGSLFLTRDRVPTLLDAAPATLYANVVLLGFVASTLGFFATPLSAYFSRRHEWQADAFAKTLTRTPEALASALVKLARDNLSNLHPHPLYAGFYYSHPTTQARVTRLLGSE
jgi:STE24 endopeptidase